MQLRLMTYNIHKCIGGVDRKYLPERIYATIAHYQPDIVLLQEVDDGVARSQHHRQIDWLGDALDFPHRLFQSNVKVQWGSYGNAILSRWPLQLAEDVELTIRPKKRRRAQIAKLHLTDTDTLTGSKHSRTVILANLHLGLAGFERRLQVRRLLSCDTLLHCRSDTPAIIAGDFNDVWQSLGKSHFAPVGFQSAVGKARTFPAIYPLRCLDGIYYRGALDASHVFVGHTDLARQASDHLPLIGQFTIQLSQALG